MAKLAEPRALKTREMEEACALWEVEKARKTAKHLKAQWRKVLETTERA